MLQEVGTRSINLKNKSDRQPVFRVHVCPLGRCDHGCCECASQCFEPAPSRACSTAAALCDRRRTARLQIAGGCGGPTRCAYAQERVRDRCPLPAHRPSTGPVRPQAFVRWWVPRSSVIAMRSIPRLSHASDLK